MDSKPFLFFAAVLLLPCTGFSSEKHTYSLGFLSPFPSTSPDSLIPFHLAQQWQSAFQVAVEVLNSENRSYEIEPFVGDSSCDWMKVARLSYTIKQKNLIGIVGPACSGAALSAAQYFDQQIPIVSFAATHNMLSNRISYPNFFRTVYGDSHQALAVETVMEKLDFRNATILCIKDYYSLSLASNIEEIAAARISSKTILNQGSNSSVDTEQIKEVFNTLNPDSVVILVVPPLIARDIWKVAMQMRKMSSSWWYFGTDGVTAFDPFSDGALDPAEVLPGQIGLAPTVGDVSDDPECQRFCDHWRKRGFPGLPVGGLGKSRSFVTHLIDAVTLYFQIIDDLVNTNTSINSSVILSVLQKGAPIFKGCTGDVEIDPRTGSRKISSSKLVMYDFVVLSNSSWQIRGSISNSTFESFSPITRPTSTVSLYNELGKQNGDLLGALVVLSATVVVIGTVVFYYRRNRNRLAGFVRIRS